MVTDPRLASCFLSPTKKPLVRGVGVEFELVKLELCKALKDCTGEHGIHRDIAIFADLEHLFVEVHR